MTEEQLRDVLARVVPDPPDSVADPVPVVRTARVRRRAQVVGVVGAVAVAAVVGVVGGRALVGDDASPQVADEPLLSGDPYTDASCPEALPANGPMPDLTSVTAIRYCAADFNGFPYQPGPPDALVDGIDDFESALSAVPDADPARCAAIDVIPSDSRLAFELADGSMRFVPVTMCTDVDLGDRTVDGAEVSRTFLGALDSQRDAADYAADVLEVDLNCQTPVSLSPAQPGRERLIAVAICPAGDPESPGGAVAQGSDDQIKRAWTEATVLQNSSDPCARTDPTASLVALTDRGDVVRLEGSPCGFLIFHGWETGQPWKIRFDATGISAS